MTTTEAADQLRYVIKVGRALLNRVGQSKSKRDYGHEGYAPDFAYEIEGEAHRYRTLRDCAAREIENSPVLAKSCHALIDQLGELDAEIGSTDEIPKRKNEDKPVYFTLPHAEGGARFKLGSWAISQLDVEAKSKFGGRLIDDGQFKFKDHEGVFPAPSNNSATKTWEALRMLLSSTNPCGATYFEKNPAPNLRRKNAASANDGETLDSHIEAVTPDGIPVSTKAGLNYWRLSAKTSKERKHAKIKPRLKPR